MHQSALCGGMHWPECIFTRKNPATWSRFSLFTKLCVLLITWTSNPNWPKRSDGDGKFRTEACGAELGRLLSLRVINLNPISSLITALLRYLMKLEHDCEVCEYVELCEGRREGVHQNSSATKAVPRVSLTVLAMPWVENWVLGFGFLRPLMAFELLNLLSRSIKWLVEAMDFFGIVFNQSLEGPFVKWGAGHGYFQSWEHFSQSQ